MANLQGKMTLRMTAIQWINTGRQVLHNSTTLSHCCMKWNLWPNCVKIGKIFPVFATLKIAFLMTFFIPILFCIIIKIWIHFYYFNIEKIAYFEGCLISALDPMKIIISNVVKRIPIFRLFRTFLQNSRLINFRQKNEKNAYLLWDINNNIY